MPGEGTGSELADPVIDRDQEDRVPLRRPWPPAETLENRRVSVDPGVAKDLIDPFAADVVAYGDVRDTLAAMIRGDDLPGVIGCLRLQAPSLTGCQVIMRSYTYDDTYRVQA